MSVPFSGKTFTFTQPDGSSFEVRGWGDQHYAVFETLEGYTVTKDPRTGEFHYATLSADKNELVPSGTRIGQADPRDVGVTPHLRVRRAAALSAARSRNTTPGQRRWEVRRQEKKAAAAKRPRTFGVPAPSTAGTVGNYVGLCLLVQFPDVPGTISRQEVDDFCNQQGYSGFGNHGSVRDYFHDVSDGKLTYTNLVTEYYTAAHNRSYYTDPAQPYGSRARELILEALNHLTGLGFDFTPLSADASGFVFACNVFYAGSVVNNWSEGLWPHSWSLATPFQAGPGRKIFDYQITDTGTQLTLGTFCHENGHMICDFPDLYDYGYESYGAGHYSLMAFGGSDERNPVQVDAYLKNEAGWTTSLTPLAPGMNATIAAGQNDFFVHAKSATEYFVIENRQKQGRDAALPDAGLAIWHVDELGSNSNQEMTPALHYECSIEQADNQFHVEHKVNLGDAEDLFSAPHSTAFGDSTGPNSRWWDGTASGLEILNVSAPGQQMTFSTAGGGVTSVPLHRYWNSDAADHFYTTDWNELGNGNYGWIYEGIQCHVHPTQAAGTVPLHRYWNSDAADHFYTTDWNELGNGNYGWVYEGVQCYVYPTQAAATVPLHRYWNSDAADHFYTTDWNELGNGNYGWVYEGVQCYVLATASPQAPAGGPPPTFSTRGGGGKVQPIPATFRYGTGGTRGDVPVPDTFRTKRSAGRAKVPSTFSYHARSSGVGASSEG